MKSIRLQFCCLSILVAACMPLRADTLFCDWQTVGGVPDRVMDVALRNGSRIENVTGIRRDFRQTRTGLVQGIRVQFQQGDSLVDSVYSVADIVSYSSGGIGGTHAPLSREVLPVREFQKIETLNPLSNFVEVGALGGYAGSDESQRAVGVNNFLYGVKAGVSPFNGAFGEHLFPAIQLGVLGESGRLRFLVGGQLRYNLVSGSEVIDTIKYYPSACSFSYPGNSTAVLPLSEEYEEVNTFGLRDSTAILLREKGEYSTGFRLDAYAEAGTLLNTSFEGAGRSPAVNADDYGQWYAGLGLVATFDQFFVGMGYSYYKLSVRTPCDNCQDLYLVNTNDTHTLELRLGYALWWR